MSVTKSSKDLNVQVTITVVNVTAAQGGADQPHVNAKGISVWATGLLLVGELAGGGMVALPQAAQYMGWLPALFGLLFFAVICAYTGTLLGTCWNILLQRFPEYRQKHCKRPYQEIAKRAVGPSLTYAVSACIDMALFGTCVAFLILAAQNLHSLLQYWFSVNISFCLFLAALALCLLPFTFLGSPKDFWYMVVLAMICTTIAAVILVIGMVVDEHNSLNGAIDTTTQSAMSTETTDSVTTEQSKETAQSSAQSFTDMFLALGVVLFAYTGHGAFSTVQQDMEKPHKWNWAILMAYILQLAYYLPIAFLGSHVYGTETDSNIISNLHVDWARAVCSVLITFHVLFSFVLMINPVSQELEHVFHVPHEFGLKRVIVRSSLVLAILFVAESIPHFGPLLSLVGGSTQTLLALFFPPICYYMLMKQTVEEDKVVYSVPNKIAPSETSAQNSSKRAVHVHTMVALLCIIIIGVVIAFGSTYASVVTLVHPKSGGFTPPCYINPWPSNTS